MTPVGHVMPHRRIHLDDVIEMLDRGDDLDRICTQLGVTRNAITTACARRGTPDQHARILAASAQLAERKRQAAAQARRTRTSSGVRIDYRRTE